MQTALITGAARRIGATFAHALAQQGWRVIAHHHRSALEAEALAAAIRAAGGHCTPVAADLADPAAVAALIPTCVAQHGPIAALINNAASFRYDSIRSMTPESWHDAMATNLAAPIRLAQAFAQQAPPGAAIVNVLDHKIAALNPDFFSYTVAKLGLAGATRLLAVAFRGRIRVNAIAPGLTLPSTKQTPEAFQRAWQSAPLGRGTTPAELAEALLLLLQTSSLNGETLLLDGGDFLVGRTRDVSLDPELGAGTAAAVPDR